MIFRFKILNFLVRQEQLELSQQVQEKDADGNDITSQSTEQINGLKNDDSAIPQESSLTDAATLLLHPEAPQESTIKFYSVSPDGDISIDADHPDIAKAVEKAIGEISVKDLVTLPAVEYINVIDEEIKRIQIDRKLTDQTAAG